MKQTIYILLLMAIICINATCVVAQPKVKEVPIANPGTSAETKHGTVVTEKLASTILRENRIGLDPNRTVKVYLPPGYANSGKSYPVVYYCHSIFSGAAKMFEDGKLVKLMERGFANGVVKEFIFVVADYSSPTTGSLYENSSTSGRWLDFTIQELLPFIDGKFRTLRHRDSRAVAGDFMGGRGALKLAMTYSDLFSVVYALHPVATGMGYIPWAKVQVDWKKVHQAKTFSELAGQGFSQIFVAINQAFLPNPNRPPFYCDFFFEVENGEPRLHPGNTKKVKDSFLLDRMLEENATNLRTLRGIAFDWGRYDPIQDHVYSVEEFSRKLEDFSIEHEAEEYRGDPWNNNWSENGRFYARVLPSSPGTLCLKSKNE